MRITSCAVFAIASLMAAPNVLPQQPESGQSNVAQPKVGLGAKVAAAVAVEEQEGDLARADRLYREALAGKDLSAADRAYANLRLGLLLQRLGRKDDAAPFLAAAVNSKLVEVDPKAVVGQDVERQKQLRERAGKLVETIANQRILNWTTPLHGIADPGLAKQLLWIGDMAVPEVIAKLQKLETEFTSPAARRGMIPRLTAGLAGFLWRNGGDAAAEYLESCSRSTDQSFREEIARTAFQAQDERMLAVATRFLADSATSGDVVRALLTSSASRGKGLEERLAPDVVVSSALEGPPASLRYIFTWALIPRELSPELLARVHTRVRTILSSTSPELGSAALAFLASRTSQQSLEGIELLLEHLPALRGTARPQTGPQFRRKGRFTAAEARRLLPHVDRCVRVFGSLEEAASADRLWLDDLAWSVANDHGPGCEDQVIDWIARGLEIWNVLEGRVTGANAARVAKLASGSANRIKGVMRAFFRAKEMPRELFPLLRERAEAARKIMPEMGFFAWPMALTRHPEAAAWIFAEWERRPDKDWAASSLVELGRHDRSESVRRGLRGVAIAAARERNAEPLLALMTMGDVEALDLLQPTMGGIGRRHHPYAAGQEGPALGPLNYLLYGKSAQYPQHGYTPEQVALGIAKVTQYGFQSSMGIDRQSVEAIPDRNVRLMADQALAAKDMNTTASEWVQLAVRRWREAAAGSAAKAAMQEWAVRVLEGTDARACHRLIFHQFSTQDVRPVRLFIERLVGSPSPGVAQRAARLLIWAEEGVDENLLIRFAEHRESRVRRVAIEGARLRDLKVEDVILPLLRDPESAVRHSAAKFFGEIVSKRAVPQLIALLRDSDEGVRDVAAESLTRIRFYHEQQAHWDRILKGLDASPASAAEKLLLQGKPGQSRQQRLMAIRSLGVLGAAEALPFLIDWTSDSDVEIAAAATAAITRIHFGAGESGAGPAGKKAGK